MIYELYSYLPYPEEGVNELRFFSQGVGQGNRGFADTNMALANHLPRRCSFEVWEIEATFNSHAYFQRVFSDGSFEIQHMSKMLLQGRNAQLLKTIALKRVWFIGSEENFVIRVSWPDKIYVPTPGRVGIVLRGDYYSASV